MERFDPAAALAILYAGSPLGARSLIVPARFLPVPLPSPLCSVRMPHRLVALLLAGALVLTLSACDDAPGVAPPAQPPVLIDLAYSPESVNADSLTPDRVTDSTVTADLRIITAAEDPDGSIDRVVFTIEPASVPDAAIAGTLPLIPDEPNLYGTAIDLTLPRIDEIYTIRTYAIDQDSLLSNVALGQIRVIPARPAP